MRRPWVWFALLVACSGAPARRTASIERDVGTGGVTSLPLARIAYDTAAMVETAAPISLTTSDGTGLELTKLDARAVVDGPLAFTELHLTFTNPQDRILEGRFAITLPDSAAISRFAMAIDGQWQEAEVVERMAARRAYEDFLHRRQDPALLEKEAGNEFRARVFPIPAKGVKELIVSYSQELADPDAPYVLPLVGLPKVKELKARVQVARVDDASSLQWDEVTLDQTDWQPDRDLSTPASSASQALGAGKVVAMRVTPELGVAPDVPETATILVDTSASRALGYPAYAAQVEDIIAKLAELSPGLTIQVAGFDQEVVAIYDGAASAAAGKISTALLGRMPLGASDLGRALAWAAKAKGRVIVIGDGVATAGETDAGKLGDAVTKLAADRLDVVLAGGIRDRAMGEALTRGRLTRDGAVLDLDDGAAAVAKRLALGTRSGIEVKVDGATAVWPQRLDGVQPGDAAMIYAWMKQAPTSVTVSLDTDRHTLSVEPAAAPLVERAAAQAEIARLEAAAGAIADRAKKQAAIDEIVAKSIASRVLSTYTALLVLETEDDYARFGIDRKALVGILAVGKKGVEVQKRTEVVTIAADVVPIEEDEDGAADKDKAEYKERDDQASDDASEAKPEPDASDANEDDGRSAGLMGSGSGQGYGVGSGRGSVRGRVAGIRAGSPSGGDSDDDAGEDEEEAAPAAPEIPDGPPAYTGRMATVMDAIAVDKLEDALDEALAWRGEDAGDVLALIALGEVFEARGDLVLAGRAYGSIIDLFPARADLRRFAGERLDRLGARSTAALELSIDTYRRAVEQRPDHLTGHRLLAFALVRAGKLEDAFAALEAGLAQDYPDDRFAGGERILREDLGLVGAAWRANAPKQKSAIDKRLKAAGAKLETDRSMRFVLSWETDANDVDFHIFDSKRGHAYFQAMQLPSGGELYADVTTGYGPECFTIRGAPKAAPYRLSIHYYSRGPMGYGMGKLEVVRHDGKGNLTIEDRPFVVMNDEAYVDLGTVE